MKKRIFALLPLFLSGCMSAEEKASIGIIGGADGPTAIFVSSTLARPAIFAAAAVVVILTVGILIAVIARSRK